MTRLDTLPFNPRGFLLIEAALTAVIIAVGLVLIMRGLGGSLAALARLQQREVLVRLAESTMNQRETEAQQFGVAPSQDVSCDAPFERYHWTLSAERVRGAPGGVSPDDVRLVTVTVAHAGKPNGLVQLQAIWPKDWIKE